jgi:hypothetical protein
LGSEISRPIFESKLPDKKTGALPASMTENDIFDYLIKCLDDKLNELNYQNIMKKKKNVENKKKNKQNSLKNKDLEKPLSKQRLSNIDDILSYIDKNITAIQSKKNSNSSNKSDMKTKFVTFFTTLYKYCNEVESIKKKLDFDVINNKIYFYFNKDKKLKELSNIEIDKLRENNAKKLEKCSKIKNLIKKIEYDKQDNARIVNLYKDEVNNLLGTKTYSNKDELLNVLKDELTDCDTKSNNANKLNTLIKSLNSYYTENNNDKFIDFIYNIVIKNKKFPNDDVKTFFDKYKIFCENLSIIISNLLNYINKNNIKKFAHTNDIFDILIQEKNKKICTILDNANININQKNGKFIKILPYTDIFHAYIMIFLIFIDYLNYYYFCDLTGTRI